MSPTGNGFRQERCTDSKGHRRGLKLAIAALLAAGCFPGHTCPGPAWSCLDAGACPPGTGAELCAAGASRMQAPSSFRCREAAADARASLARALQDRLERAASATGVTWRPPVDTVDVAGSEILEISDPEGRRCHALAALTRDAVVESARRTLASGALSPAAAARVLQRVCLP